MAASGRGPLRAITGEEAISAAPLIPAPLAWLLVILAVIGVGARPCRIPKE